MSVLVHNASGWQRDSFAESGTDVAGRSLAPVTADSIDAQLQVDARAGALLLHEFIVRHRDARRQLGTDRHHDLG